MTLDPTVQVAAISVFATAITTFGVIAVAIINNRKERTKAASAGVEVGLDERAVLGRIFILMNEAEEKDARIHHLEEELAVCKAENRILKDMKETKNRKSSKGGHT